jgi:hypothetical protein
MKLYPNLFYYAYVLFLIATTLVFVLKATGARS